MNIVNRVLFIGIIALLVSCKRSSDFRVVNLSDKDWEKLEPFEATEIIFKDINQLLRKYKECPNMRPPEDKMQLFYERQLENYRFYMPGENDQIASPLITREEPQCLTEKESREKLHLLLAWTEGELLQYRPYILNDKLENCFNFIGLEASLDGVVTVLQTDTTSKTATQNIILLEILRVLAEWDSKGDAKLYWWNFKEKQSLLYITPHTATIFYENSQGKIEFIFCIQREYYLNKKIECKDENIG